MPNYDKVVVKGKAESYVNKWNRWWMEDLAARADQEDIWSRAYDSFISRHDAPITGFSNLYFSMSWPYQQASTAQIGMNLLGEEPYIRLRAKGQEDITNTKISEAFVHHYMKQGEFWIEGLTAIQLALIYGDAWIRYPWVQELRDYSIPTPIFDFDGTITGFDYKHKMNIRLLNYEGFKFESRSPWRVVIDAAAYAPREGRMRRLVDTDARVPYEQLEAMAEQGIIDKEALKKVNPDGYQDCGMVNRSNRGEGRWETKDQSKKGLVFIRECIDFQTYRKCIIANWDVILNGDSGQQIETLGGPPYQHVGLYNMPLEPYSKGIPWMLEFHEKARNHYINTDMDEYSLAAYAPTIVPAGSDLSKDKTLRVKPGMTITGRPDEYGELRKSTRFAETFNRVGFLEKDAQFITGMSAEATGLTAPTGTTATSSSIAAQQMLLFIRHVTWKLSHSFGKMALKLNMTAWQMADQTQVEVLPAQLVPQYQMVRGMSGKEGVPPSLNVDYIPKDRSYASASIERTNFLIALLDRMLPLASEQIDPKTGIKMGERLLDGSEIFQMIFREAGIPGYERLFAQPIQENNPFAGQNFQKARGNGFSSPNQPNPLYPNQHMGNFLGQLASAANPSSNNGIGRVDISQMMGIQ